MPFKGLANEATDLRVDSRHHLGQALHERDVEVAVAQRVGHLKTDIARADDHDPPHASSGEAFSDRERVIDRVQQMHALEVSPPIGGRCGAAPVARTSAS